MDIVHNSMLQMMRYITHVESIVDMLWQIWKWNIILYYSDILVEISQSMSVLYTKIDTRIVMAD